MKLLPKVSLFVTDTLKNNIGNFFRDDNEDNLYNTGEFIYQKAVGALQCAISSFAQPNIQDTCDSGLSAVLRQQLVFSSLWCFSFFIFYFILS